MGREWARGRNLACDMRDWVEDIFHEINPEFQPNESPPREPVDGRNR